MERDLITVGTTEPDLVTLTLNPSRVIDDLALAFAVDATAAEAFQNLIKWHRMSRHSCSQATVDKHKGEHRDLVTSSPAVTAALQRCFSRDGASQLLDALDDALSDLRSYALQAHDDEPREEFPGA